MKTLCFYLHLLKTSMKASLSKRGAFLIESSFIIANNLIYAGMWWIFFRQFQTIEGWEFKDMVTLFAISGGGYGLMQLCFGGIRDLSKMIVSGDLDPFMTQPKNILLHVAGCKSRTKGWGNLISSALLLWIGGVSSPFSFLLVIISILCSGIVFCAVSTIAHSIPFWLGSMGALGKKYVEALYLFAFYPTNIYSGLLQIVMFTLIPAGLISYLPVELIRKFSLPLFLILLISSTLTMAIAFFIFYRGLKRYESGNRFGIRA